jgi:predicted RND superfamily exporter protein
VILVTDGRVGVRGLPQAAIDRIDDAIAAHPGRVVLAFLVLTGVFVAGLGNIETESGQGQFTEDLDSYEAFQDIQREFGASFTAGGASTTLLQDGQNVLSKRGLLRNLEAQRRLAARESLRVERTSSPARTVARTLDPGATTLEAQMDAVEAATPGEIDAAVRTAATEPGFRQDLSEDFVRETASASAMQGSVGHASDIDDREQRVRRLVDPVDGVFIVGSSPNTVSDSLLLTLPAALLFIVLFLLVAYRDLVDLLAGVVALLLTLVWTFGFLGLIGIAFNPLLIAVPPLLIAIGIDFGIHAVNRYREERVAGADIERSMRVTTDQLLVAFFMVTGTTVIGFLSNLSSALGPIRDFAVTAAAGMVFTFCIFGVFLPALKVFVDRLRERYPIPTLSRSPLGSEGSPLGRLLSGGIGIARRGPVLFLVLVLVASVGGGVYAAGIGSGFDQESFIPPADRPAYLDPVPEPFRPPDYDYPERYDFRETQFDRSEQVFMYVEGDMERDGALESLHRATLDPPDTLVRDEGGRYAEAESIVDVVRSRADRDPEFRQLVARNDADGDGIPDDDIDAIYDYLLDSSSRDRALSYLSEDRRSARVVLSAEDGTSSGAVAGDIQHLSTQYRADASPTGNSLIFEEASALIMETVVVSLAITLAGAAVFLVVAYWLTEGRPSLGLVNLVPIAITVVGVVASMRYLGVQFNAFNGVILSLTIGLGIDYSVHVTHRFADEFDQRPLLPALRRTVVGTGGALLGSMLTTVFGVGVLVLAVNPAIGVFGLLTSLSIVYAFVASLFVLPSVLVVWARLRRRWTRLRSTASAPTPTDVAPQDD